MGHSRATEHPDQPIQVGIGLIRRGDCFLVRQRPPETVYAGYWEFPGGKCEPAEDPAQATARECFEETGLTVVVGPLRLVTTYRYPHGVVELFFHDCTTLLHQSEPAAGSGFRWVKAADLAALRFPEANEAVIEQLASKSGQWSVNSGRWGRP
ncbi:MAG: (deoxy)nucleoside triphosphate pyrophosphohydrolase [Isosphaerales bacterium]